MIVALSLVLVALLAPWATLMPLSDVTAGTAINLNPAILWNVGVLLAISALVGSVDWRLGVFVGYVALNALRAPAAGRPWSYAAAIVLGALAWTLLRERPMPWARWVLVGGGLVQIALGAVQLWVTDPIWHQTDDARRGGLMALGTIGHQTMFGAFLAIVGTLAPWWCVPVFVGGVLMSGSRLAWLALGAALAIRLWTERRL